LKKQIVFTLATATLVLGATATTAGASIVRVNNHDVGIKVGGYEVCSAYTETRGAEAKGKFWAQNGGACQAWLERQRFNADGSLMYNWQRVSDFYWLQNVDSRETGWHWNGDNARSRVCIVDTRTGEKGCAEGVW
jgi:hypothetical protein